MHWRFVFKLWLSVFCVSRRGAVVIIIPRGPPALQSLRCETTAPHPFYYAGRGATMPTTISPTRSEDEEG
eukprot:9298189-Pyramimonas_sp.AAC.1